MATFKSAKNAKVRINGNILGVKSWNVPDHADEIDTTNTEDAGFYSGITGIRSIEFTIEFDIDCAVNPFAAPLSFKPGQLLANVALYLNDTTSPFWDIPFANVLEMNMPTNVKEALKGTLRCKGTGAFVEPSTAATI